MERKNKILKFLTEKKKIVIPLAVVAVCVIGFSIKNETSVRYETQPLTRCTITQVVEASGTINPVNTVSVGSTVSGLMKEIYVDYNSEVKKGQLLAQMDPTTFQSQLEQNEAQIINAEATLAKLNAEMVYAQKTYNRYKNLYSKNFIARSELDQAESDYLAKKAAIGAQQASIAQARANYKTAKANLGYTKIIAPVNGTIISRDIDVGQPVAASFQAPELFTIAQDLTKMQIEVNVSEADIGNVKTGQDVEYSLDGYPDQTFYGKVTQVRLDSTTTSNVVTYTVIVSVDNKDLKLKPGMTANVSIITNRRKNVLCTTSIALKYSPESNGKKYKQQGIWLLEGNQPVRIPVTEGASDDSHVEIISNKVRVGDKVIVGSTGGKGSKAASTNSNKRRGGPPGMF
ncbi:MAG TPA: efflux RND transporter periplasmic adaptor subunit [Cyanobacteria bacterium UBA11991]|nr:efflux RND transporter periplasmic adaptor subunit [Cyanobacteriota bacterium]MDY6357890.1 efflux RND transporter periplasmic adaptor subunit [Cyanobacteriota bacterium]MDY6364228.1 efflux RND transporter periplasmic adaptor subunit [Cyanobacteriota bacterium]MDY6383162.1 efflux RND transporter periplasmic adaptor subunit [Cyanobacteriota bacterium]HCB10721.1 efflux RND transporter periplasmic adaptor subunit [Cyanobacteria bacterium UBA11991]